MRVKGASEVVVNDTLPLHAFVLSVKGEKKRKVTLSDKMLFHFFSFFIKTKKSVFFFHNIYTGKKSLFGGENTFWTK